jgi:predicted ferric reductase
VLILGPKPPGGGFFRDLSIAFGFAGIAMMGGQFALTARFRRATAPFGIDIIYFFHRYLAVIAFAIISAHVLILQIGYPSATGLIHPWIAPWHMTAGRISFVLIVLLIATSLGRKKMHIEYDRWRLAHAVLAVGALLLALGHIEGVGYYINAPLNRVLWTALVLFWFALLFHIRVVRPWLIANKPYRVKEVRKEPGRVWTLALEPEHHQSVAFMPGQFAWVTLRATPFQLKEHPFSISSSPEKSGCLEFTVKELGDFTRTIGDIRPGEIGYVDGPYGAFSIDRYRQAPGYAFIAGGVGIAPIMSMIRAMADRGDTRSLILFDGNRLWDHVLFREELDSLKARLNLRVIHVLGEPPEDWRGERGLVTREILERHLPDDYRTLEYFICGPTPMIRRTERDLRALHVPLRRIHSEIFDIA